MQTTRMQLILMFPILQVFPIVIYFSAVIGILYYWGLMQIIVCKIAWIMQFSMGTTAIESLNAATNIFIGMVSSPLIFWFYFSKFKMDEIVQIGKVSCDRQFIVYQKGDIVKQPMKKGSFVPKNVRGVGWGGIGRSRGVCPAHAPPMGPDSFILTCKIFKT